MLNASAYIIAHHPIANILLLSYLRNSRPDGRRPCPVRKMKYFSIKENSFIAKLAARKLSSKNVAIVFGTCIHLYGVAKADFLSDERWLRHELKHIEQYERLGFLRFIFIYLWQNIRVGYHRCGLECEAREAEDDELILGRFAIR